MNIELLKNIEKTVTITSSERLLITTLFKEKTYKKGEYFLKEGNICKYVGFITKGMVRYFVNVDGEEKNYGFGQENEYVSNYESFIPQNISKRNIQFLEDAELLLISHKDLERFYAEVLNGERFGRIIVGQLFIQGLQDLDSFYSDSPEIRYKKFVNDHPDLLQRIPQYHIASYIGVKPQSLSRIRKRNL